jgi:leucyl/phenylalanyl-tRNA--protein transferase
MFKLLPKYKMPIFKISKEETNYPPAQYADSEGLLCEGGGLEPEQLINAYKSGLYFWFHPMRYINWWSPDPRIVLFPEEMDIPGYLNDELKKLNYSITFNKDLEGVMRLCQSIENKEEMSPAWVTERTIRVFKTMEESGHVQSVEVWKDKKLVGGLFGVAIGRVFFGEYICSNVKYASEFALISLVKKLKEKDFKLIDLHKDTNETIDIGLSEISRNEYLALVKEYTLKQV